MLPHSPPSSSPGEWIETETADFQILLWRWTLSVDQSICQSRLKSGRCTEDSFLVRALKLRTVANMVHIVICFMSESLCIQMEHSPMCHLLIWFMHTDGTIIVLEVISLCACFVLLTIPEASQLHQHIYMGLFHIIPLYVYECIYVQREFLGTQHFCEMVMLGT